MLYGTCRRDCVSQQVSAVQTSPHNLILQDHHDNTLIAVKMEMYIRGVAVGGDHLAVWDGKTVVVHNIAFGKGFSKFIGQ